MFGLQSGGLSHGPSDLGDLADTCDVRLGFRCTWPASFPAQGGEWTGKAAAGLKASSTGPGPLPRVWGPQRVFNAPHSPGCRVVSAQKRSRVTCQGYHSLSGQFAGAFMRPLLYTALLHRVPLLPAGSLHMGYALGRLGAAWVRWDWDCFFPHSSPTPGRYTEGASDTADRGAVRARGGTQPQGQARGILRSGFRGAEVTISLHQVQAEIGVSKWGSQACRTGPRVQWKGREAWLGGRAGAPVQCRGQWGGGLWSPPNPASGLSGRSQERTL